MFACLAKMKDHFNGMYVMHWSTAVLYGKRVLEDP